MTLLNFFFVIINILIIIFGYIFLKNKIEKLVTNKEILENIKKEINQIIVRLNETTVNNINLVEEKAKRLEKLIRLAERKASGLDIKITDIDDQLDLPENRLNNLTYSPQKIAKQTQKIIENQTIEIEEKALDGIEEVMKELTLKERVKLLMEEGWEKEEIKKKLKISSGELELIINIEGFKDY